MGAFLNWDRDDHFAADHGISGISRKTVQYCGGMVDIGFTAYPIGELLCQFLNYNPQEFIALKQQRDGRIPVSPEKLAAVLAQMPYYQDLMAQLEPDRQRKCAQLFCQYHRGILWQDAEECFRIIENRYLPFSVLSSEAVENGQSMLSVFTSQPVEVLNNPSLGASSYGSVAKPEPSFLIRCGTDSPQLAAQYRLTRLTELLYLELMHLLQSGGSIHRCHNCGRFFVPEQGYHYRYCNRIAPGEAKRSCREVGATRARQNKLERSTVLTAYQRAYKRYYARVLKQRWSKEQFQCWQAEALKIRSEAEAAHWSEQSLEDKLHALAEKVSHL